MSYQWTPVLASTFAVEGSITGPAANSGATSARVRAWREKLSPSWVHLGKSGVASPVEYTHRVPHRKAPLAHIRIRLSAVNFRSDDMTHWTEPLPRPMLRGPREPPDEIASGPK